jgi:RNA polymerase sigma factor (sigma-70 family)
MDVVHRKVARFGLTAEDEADVAQTCVLAVFNHLADFNGELGTFDAWIGGFAANALKMYRRAIYRRHSQEISVQEVPEVLVPEPEGPRVAISQAFDQLSTADRDILKLKFEMQMTSEEIAVKCGLNSAQTRKRISRAVERLRRHPAVQSLLRETG